MTVDVHRHLLTPRLFEALARRAAAPRIARARGGGWQLEVAHEVPSPVRPDEAPELEAGVDRGVVALSAALGVEALPADEAHPILAAWRADGADLPEHLDFWDAGADADAARLCLPANELGTPAALERSAPLLERLEHRGGVLFVHPGPAAPGAWLPALTDYPGSLMGAWLAWIAHGRKQHPRLKVLFAALAGLGPLHLERIAARGGPALAPDDLTFYDTSSYGPMAAEAVARVVGARQLVYGSDHPWATGDPANFPISFSTDNPRRLLEAA